MKISFKMLMLIFVLFLLGFMLYMKVIVEPEIDKLEAAISDLRKDTI